ncbi:hypothetical protein ONZ45_g2829 [Pleurotus djamor]|nr:hypothetical protein ONZ45_g2829 [Pleurotus djamor]
MNPTPPQSAFIGAVQAQVLDWTREENDNFLQTLTNWASFIGLTLDILGVGTGVIRTLSLQHSVRRLETLTSRLRDNADRLQRRFQQFRGTQCPDDLGGALGQRFLQNFESINDQLEKQLGLLDLIREIQRFRNDLVFADTVGDEETDGFRAPVPITSPVTSVSGLKAALTHVAKFFKNFPHQIPMLSMGGGTFFLLCSVVWLATSTQPKAIWIPCVIVSAITLACTLIPMAWFYEGNMEEALDNEIDAFEELELKQ